jgi:hypothetical protein
MLGGYLIIELKKFNPVWESEKRIIKELPRFRFWAGF